MKAIAEEILKLAVQAPSGGNSQPWEFQIHDNQIDIFALPERDHPILNFRERGTLVALGALLENITIAAPAFGYKTLIKISSNSDLQKHWC